MGAPTPRVGDLEINQDLRVQERMWRFQRTGWIAMALLTLAGVIGLFGHGPISRATTGSSEEPLWVEYDRFGRFQEQSLLRIHAQSPPPGKPLRVRIPSGYLADVTVQHVTPFPSRTILEDGGIVFEFITVDSTDRVVITLSLQWLSLGRVIGELSLPEGPSARVAHLVYP